VLFSEDRRRKFLQALVRNNHTASRAVLNWAQQVCLLSLDILSSESSLYIHFHWMWFKWRSWAVSVSEGSSHGLNNDISRERM
jgi:hypothetical protein